jgi:dipeptidyl-peptidase-4
MDGWMVKACELRSGEEIPRSVLCLHRTGRGDGYRCLWQIHGTPSTLGDMAKDGYIYISLDNRGTPAPKGAAWRKSIYQERSDSLTFTIRPWPLKRSSNGTFVDPDRIAVWGWSGGGSATLNLMFQYPEIYKTGIAIAAVANELTYDNIYQERYMGLPTGEYGGLCKRITDDLCQEPER